MEWTTPVSIVVAAAVLVTTVGALVTLVLGPLTSPYQVASAAVVVLVAGLLAAMVAVGARGEGGHWLENGGYW